MLSDSHRLPTPRCTTTSSARQDAMSHRAQRYRASLATRLPAPGGEVAPGPASERCPLRCSGLAANSRRPGSLRREETDSRNRIFATLLDASRQRDCSGRCVRQGMLNKSPKHRPDQQSQRSQSHVCRPALPPIRRRARPLAASRASAHQPASQCHHALCE